MVKCASRGLGNERKKLLMVKKNATSLANFYVCNCIVAVCLSWFKWGRVKKMNNSYKEAHVNFVSGHVGTSVAEIALVVSSAPLGLALRNEIARYFGSLSLW